MTYYGPERRTVPRPDPRRIFHEVQPFIKERKSILDRFGFEKTPMTLDECVELVEKRDRVVSSMLRGNEGGLVFPEKAHFGEFFIDMTSGMHFGMVYLPSSVAKEVGASIAVLGVRPDEGVENLIGVEQKERKAKFVRSLGKVTGIFMIDHGYGAGDAINIPLVDALGKGNFYDLDNQQKIQLSENELVVSLMTKGSGGTYLDKQERGGREGLPDFSMESALAQYWEVKSELEVFLTRELLAETLSANTETNTNKMIEMLRDEEQVDHASQKIAGEILRRSELLSGTWMSNRMVANDGHSMAGWEMVRDCVARVYGEIRPEMVPFFSRIYKLRKELQLITNAYGPDMLKNLGVWDNREGKLWKAAWDLKSISLIDDIQSHNSGLTDLSNAAPLTLGEIASISLRDSYDDQIELTDSLSWLRQLLYKREPNATYHSETPLVIGPKAGKSEPLMGAMEIDGKDAVYLTNVAKSPGLRVLLAMNSIHPDLGILGFKIGSAIKLVEKELGDFIDNNAFGVAMIRAVHLLGLAKYLPAVSMNDDALKKATQVLGANTMRRMDDQYQRVMMKAGKAIASKLSVIRVWEGVNDKVLNSTLINNLGRLLQRGMETKGNSVLVTSKKDGHYLGRAMKTRIWAEIFGRNRAVVHHRKMVTMYLAEWLKSHTLGLEL